MWGSSVKCSIIFINSYKNIYKSITLRTDFSIFKESLSSYTRTCDTVITSEKTERIRQILRVKTFLIWIFSWEIQQILFVMFKCGCDMMLQAMQLHSVDLDLYAWLRKTIGLFLSSLVFETDANIFQNSFTSSLNFQFHTHYTAVSPQ